jgi:hypothetical protein
MKKWLWETGLCVAGILLTGAVAVSTVDKLLIEPLIVNSISELAGKYIAFREQYGPIAPPSVIYQDVAEQMSKGDWSFLKGGWFFTFEDGVLYVPEKSALAQELKLPALIQAREDIKTGEIYFFSAPLTNGAAGNFSGLAAFKAPEFMSYEKDVPLDRFLSDELSPRRVVWEITLKSEADAWADLAFQSNEAQASELLEGGGMMRMMVPEENTNDLWLCLEPQTEGGINLNVFAPEGFTNRVEIYSSTDLISNVWSIAAQNLYPSGTNPAVWNTGFVPVHFYRAGNMDIDSDGDGINDAREIIVHKTNPNEADSDGDTVSDYQELYVNFTDPNNNDTSPPVVWIASPDANGRKAVLP